MISPLATRLDVINNGSYSKAGIVSQLSAVPVAFGANLQVAHPKKFGLAQMPAGERNRAALFASTVATGRTEDLRGPRCNRISDSPAKPPYFVWFLISRFATVGPLRAVGLNFLPRASL
jgi:hypothetical protein